MVVVVGGLGNYRTWFRLTGFEETDRCAERERILIFSIRTNNVTPSMTTHWRSTCNCVPEVENFDLCKYFLHGFIHGMFHGFLRGDAGRDGSSKMLSFGGGRDGGRGGAERVGRREQRREGREAVHTCMCV